MDNKIDMVLDVEFRLDKYFYVIIAMKWDLRDGDKWFPINKIFVHMIKYVIYIDKVVQRCSMIIKCRGDGMTIDLLW